MDPNSALADLAEALHTDDQDHAAEALVSLRAWLNTGGFAPEWATFPAAACYCADALPLKYRAGILQELRGIGYYCQPGAARAAQERQRRTT